jgi:CRISPR-associated protein Cas2
MNASNPARTLYLVCYDVCCPKRLRRVYKFLLGYRVGGQKSFFECWLTLAELRAVQSMLSQLIDLDEDRVHIFQLDPRMECDRLGLAKAPATEVFLLT